MVVRVNSPLASGTSITNTTYSIDSNETAPVAGAAVSTTVSSAPLLSVSKTDSPDPVTAGGNLTYTLSYRSEEHTSELQSRPHLVCRLLLEKKKNTYILID